MKGAELWAGPHSISEEARRIQGVGRGLFYLVERYLGRSSLGQYSGRSFASLKDGDEGGVSSGQGGGASKTGSWVMGLSGIGGLDYLVLNHLGAAPAGAAARSAQATSWLMQVLRLLDLPPLGPASALPGRHCFSYSQVPSLGMLGSTCFQLWLHPRIGTPALPSQTPPSPPFLFGPCSSLPMLRTSWF